MSGTTTYGILAVVFEVLKFDKEQECIPVGCVPSTAVAMSIPLCTGQGCVCIPACTGQVGVCIPAYTGKVRGVYSGGVCPEGSACGCVCNLDRS